MKTYYPGLSDKCKRFLDVMYQDLFVIAREHGYALTVHGSLSRDIDLVAVPWSDQQVSPPEEFVEAFIKKAAEVSPTEVAFLNSKDKNPEEKPHGRLCWVIHLGGPYIDLSVIKR